MTEGFPFLEEGQSLQPVPETKSKPKSKSTKPFLSDDSEACLRHFSAVVAQIPASDLEVWNADPEIVRVNVDRGVSAIRPHEAHVKEALPLVSIGEILELPSLSLALGLAANKVFAPASPQEIRARQQQLRPSRSRTLRYLEIAGELGLVPQDRVAAIRAGTGPMDEARDAVAIVALFNERSDVLRGKHPFSEPALQQLAADGNWLLKQLLPKGATAGKSERSAEALLRDRLWTALVRRYDGLYQAGVAVWGRRGVDAHIPALLARAATPAKPKEEPAPAGSLSAPA
jgi:hypothetical protein